MTNGLNDLSTKQAELVDTHCHIHEVSPVMGDDFVHSKWAEAGIDDPTVLVGEAVEAGVNRLICVGTTPEDSEAAVKFVQDQPNCWASIGIHPHEAKKYSANPDKLQKFRNLVGKGRVVAIGECGLDYY